MIIDPTPITKMTDMDACRDLRKEISALLRGLKHPADGWIEDRNWAVMPQMDFGGWAQAERIAAAARDLGYDECVAMCTFPVDCYLVPMTAQAIVDFGFDPTFSDNVLAPRDLGFAIYRADYSYAVLAGPRSFVRKALGCSFATARKEVVGYYGDGSPAILPDYAQYWLDLYGKNKDDDEIPMEPVHEPGPVTLIEDRAEASALFEKARPLVSGAGHFSREYVRAKNWVVVPRRLPFGLRETESMTETVIEYGHKALFGVPSSDTAIEIVAYRIPMNQDAVIEFAEIRAKKYSVIFPIDLSFAILIADQWYYLLGGPEDFVRKAFDCSISDAGADFEYYYELQSDYPLDDYQQSSDWPPPHVKRRMHAIAERYRVFDPE